MSVLTHGVSAAIGVLCLVGAALMWGPGGRHNPRLAVALTLTGSAGLIGTQLGVWARRLVLWANGEVAHLIGRFTGAAVTGVLAIAAVYVLVLHVMRKEISERTLGTAAFVPLAVTTIPGPAGAAALATVTAITGGVGWLVGAALGLN